MFQHFIITPFSYRSSYHTKKRGQDPLKISSLEHRFKMFETTCLPSVLSQKNRDFTWVLIIDRALPKRFFNRLKELTLSCRNVQLHVHKNETNYGKSDWLKPYIQPGAQYVITSELDDDDGIFFIPKMPRSDIKNAILYNPLELRGMGFVNLLKDKIKRLKDSIIGVYRLPK